MTHGDDDGLRLPPVIAPKQIQLVPILRDKSEDSAVVKYCEELAAELNRGSAFGEPIRASVDRKPGRAIDKRWSYIKRGVPIVCEVGARDMAASAVTVIRRDRARNGERIEVNNDVAEQARRRTQAPCSPRSRLRYATRLVGASKPTSAHSLRPSMTWKPISRIRPTRTLSAAGRKSRGRGRRAQLSRWWMQN